MSRTLNNLLFDNSFYQLPQSLYSKTPITPLANPELIHCNTAVADLLNINVDSIDAQELAAIFSGNIPLVGAEPLAMKYTGHQFGHYNPELGDGRGLLLGEILNDQQQRWDLHVKGAGTTPYSRFGDGRAVLRSSIREYLVSEAMSGLGVPTTRALCLVGSSEYAMREGMEPCASIVRVTQCHIRFGHFEYLYHTGQHDELKQLADYCIKRYFANAASSVMDYGLMFEQIIDKSAYMVAQWQAIGFVHAVMNTDNMSLIGETFDYGPYVFMDRYQKDYVGNHSDHQKRYSYERQPDVMQWNLSCLAQALIPLIDKEELIDLLNRFQQRYQWHYLSAMRTKMGWFSVQKGDEDLILQFNALMENQHIDMVRFLRSLSRFNSDQSSFNLTTITADLAPLLDLSIDRQQTLNWLMAYSLRCVEDDSSLSERQQRMLKHNPKYILRSYMAEEVIKASHHGDHQLLRQMMTLLRDPYDEHELFDRYAQEPPGWADSIGLSCSS